MIHADGMRLVDGAGHPIVLKGVNVEGWLLWNGHMWGCGFHSETVILERLTDLVGAEETARFRAAIYARYFTEQDVARIADASFNVIRIMFNHRLLEMPGQPETYDEAGWRILDQALDWCEKHRVYVVLDLHSVPGGQSRMFVDDPEPGPLIWSSPPKRAQTIAMWKTIAQRYKDRTIVAGYDLLNEPAPPKGEDLVDMYKQLISAIRQVDANHMIILQGANFARDFSIFPGPLDSNQTYSFHLYTWFGDDRKNTIDKISQIAKKQNVPLWCGEWGENTCPMLTSTREMFERPESGIQAGWCYWVWKRAPTRADFPYLIGLNLSDKWQQVCQWINHPLLSRRPSKADALTGMKEFLDAVDIKASVENKELMTILTSRQ